MRHCRMGFSSLLLTLGIYTMYKSCRTNFPCNCSSFCLDTQDGNGAERKSIGIADAFFNRFGFGGERADGMTSQDALMVVYLSNLTRTQISIAESRLQSQQQSDQ